MTWLKIGLPVAAAVLVSSWLYGEYRYYSGSSDVKKEMAAEYNKKLAVQLKENEELSLKQREIEEEYIDEIFKLQENADRYIADVRTNVKRLYINTPSKCVSEDESDTERAERKGRTELPSDVAERLVRTRERADELAIKFNMCVDYVNNNYKHVNLDK